MPQLKSRKIVITMDMAGCPNRCRHCWLGHMPNNRVDGSVLRDVVRAFKEWKMGSEDNPYFDKVLVNSWFREPDFAPNYKELYNLEVELGGEPLRFELLSIWRLARDEKYAKWAKDIGTNACQISFFGMEENTDFFTGRKGAFKDALTATNRLIDAGIVPRWQLFLNERNKNELGVFIKLIEDMNLEEKVNAMGREFQLFAHVPSPDGEAFNLEDIRPTKDIINYMPEYLINKTVKHFNATNIDEVIGQAEKDLLPKLLKNNEPWGDKPGQLAFMITPDLDVYPNAGEMKRWWCLGNLMSDGIDTIMDRYINNKTLGFQINYNVPVSEMAGKYGRKGSEHAYVESDLITRWMRMWGEDNFI